MTAQIKDPLQAGSSPFEVLGVESGDSAAAVDAAFRATLSRATGAALSRALDARRILIDPSKRALARLLLYDPADLARLQPSPLGDPGALGPERRARTAAAWERALAAGFPDPRGVHSLALLWYWAALRGEPLPDDGAEIDLATLWRRAIAYWAVLVTGDEMAPAVRRLVTQRLRDDFDRLPFGDGRALHDLLDAELAYARAVAGAQVLADGRRVVGGRILLAHLGLLERVCSLDAALAAALSPYAEIDELLRQERPDAALEAIERLPRGIAAAAATLELAARAQTQRGQRHASAREHARALDCFDIAVQLAAAEAVKKAARDAVVAVCLDYADEPRAQSPDPAIAVLDRGVTLTGGDERLELVLAKELGTRGISRLNKTQSEFDPAKDDPEALCRQLDVGLADLERAAALGFAHAAAELGMARTVVAETHAAHGSQLAYEAIAMADRLTAQRRELEAFLRDARSRGDESHCAKDCGRPAEATLTFEQTTVTLCRRHADELGGLLDSPRMGDNPGAFALLETAREHLRTAARIDPASARSSEMLATVAEHMDAIEHDRPLAIREPAAAAPGVANDAKRTGKRRLPWRR